MSADICFAAIGVTPPPLYTFLPKFNLNQIRTFLAKIATKHSKIISLIIKINGAHYMDLRASARTENAPLSITIEKLTKNGTSFSVSSTYTKP